MRGDFARLTFDPTKHYMGVLPQQGRVWLEADWNEHVFDRQNLLWQETFDIIGACGVPEPGTAFQISPNPDPASQPFDFLIAGGPGSQGRYYVDGILCQLGQNATYLSQPDFPDAPTIQMPTDGGDLRALVYLEVWQRLITYLEDDTLREIALGGPDTATRLKTVAQVKVRTGSSDDAPNLTCANADQFLPQPGQGTLTTLQPTDSQPDDLCKLPDPSSYTGRENHLYRVEIHNGGDVLGSNTGFAFTEPLAQDTASDPLTLILQNVLSPEQLDALNRSGIVSLMDSDGQTEIAPVTGATTDSSSSTTQLTLSKALSASFTVAKNATVTGGVARFKWSQDNAAFAVRVTGVSEDRLTLTLSSLGRDRATALRQLNPVEISDDAGELGPARGHLTYLAGDPDPDQFTVTLADRLPDNFQVNRHLILRRWDGESWAKATFDAATTPDMNLGDGIHIQFGGHDLRPGDFWQFAARSADGSVEALTNAPPFGIIRHTCPLAVVKWDFQVLFDEETIVKVARDIDFSNDQISQLEQKLHDSHKTLWNASEVEVLIGSVGATQGQLSALREKLAGLSKDTAPRLTFTVLEDCRQPFHPLTRPCCDCTVTVAPGDSLSAAFDKISGVGGTVCILPGVYELTDTVTVSGKEGLTIRGAGAATIITAPTSAVTFRFEDCTNLTLRDLTLSSGQQQPPPPNVTARQTGGAGAEQTGSAQGSGATGGTNQPSNTAEGFLLEGVVTFVGCQVVNVTNCLIICNGFLPGRQLPTRSCISFTPQGFLLPDARIVTPPQGNNKFTLGDHLTSQIKSTSPTPMTFSLKTATERRFVIDFTLRNCRLYVDAGQIGLFVAEGVGVLVEDNWCLSLNTLTPPGLDALPETSETQEGDAGLAFFGCRFVTAVNNLIIGLDIALTIKSCQNLTLKGNTIQESLTSLQVVSSQNLMLQSNSISGSQNIDFEGIDLLQMNENVFETQDSITLFIEDANEVILVGNELRHVGSAVTKQVDSVAFISADSAIVSNNSFFTEEAQFGTAVTIFANSIIYTGNRSVCVQPPATADVILLGPTNTNGEATGSITAVSNTCLEPLSAEVTDFEGTLQGFRKQQASMVSQFLGTQDPAQRKNLLEQLIPLANDGQQLAQRLNEIVSSGNGPVSLLASAAFTVTGMNLLSNSLVRAGIGSDQGSVEGVPPH